MRRGANWMGRLQKVWGLVAALGCCTASAQGTEGGLRFLRQNQLLSGEFGRLTGEEPALATAEAIAAFRALGLEADGAVLSARLFLIGSTSPVDSELVLARSRALAGSPWQSPQPSLTAHAQGFEAADALHSALSLQLLSAAGLTHLSEAASLARAISALAPADGCYRVAGDGPSLSTTAEVVRALRDYTFIGDVHVTLPRVVGCLLQRQRSGGEFGDPATTALVTLALLSAPGGERAGGLLGSAVPSRGTVAGRLLGARRSRDGARLACARRFRTRLADRDRRVGARDRGSLRSRAAGGQSGPRGAGDREPFSQSCAGDDGARRRDAGERLASHQGG